MKQQWIVTVILFALIACKNNNKEKPLREEKMKGLRADTVNVVKLSDTLMIAEGACRGCEYEESVRFEIDDSLGIIKLVDVITRDYSSPETDGGSVSKNLVLVAQKKGSTTFKLYKIWNEKTRSADSAHFQAYTIEVK